MAFIKGIISWNKGKIFSLPKICKVNGCNKSSHYKQWGKKGYCANHIALIRRNGKPEFTKPRRLNGSGTITRGYKKITINGKQIPEHRYIMEQYIGRPIKPFPEEIIHHINGNSLDNRIENLILTSQSKHIRTWEFKRFRNNYSKECIDCHKILLFSNYYKDNRCSDGYMSKCKNCFNLYISSL